MNSLPAFYFLEPEPLVKALVKTAKIKINLGSWQGLPIIAYGPRNGKIVGYKSNGKPIYAGSSAAQQLVAILQAKHAYTPEQQDVALVKWLLELGLQGAIDAEQVHLSKEGASLLQEAFSLTPQPLGGGKWAVSKASLLPHLGEPLRPSEEKQTGWAAEMASGQYGDGSFPPLSELTELPAGKFAGSHGNLLFVDKGGHKWVFKASDPIIARAEEAACRLGRLLLGNLIPAVKYVEVKGKGGALIQILEGQTWQESSSQHSDPQMENLKKYKELIIKHQVVDWLVSNHDSHAGNFLSQGGQLAAIDKGQSWKFLGKDKLEADYSPNPSHPIYNKFWEKISEGAIDPKGLIEAVADVVNRADQISPEQFQLIVAPYVSTASGWTHADPQAQLQKMLSRLQNLRSDFEGFLSKELGKKVVLPKPETVQVAWEVAPGEKPAAPAVKKPPTKLEIPLAPAVPVVPESPPQLTAVETTPVTAEKPKAGWPLTKKGGKSVEVTIHTPGVVPASWWPPGVPAPGMKLTTVYKGKQYGLEVGENWEGKKPSFVVTYPDGKMVGFTSLNAAGDSLYLFNQGLPLTLSATEKKAKGISLGSKVFQLKLFEQELSEAAGKAEEPPAPVTQTVAELEEQKVVAPEQKSVTVLGLLGKLIDGAIFNPTAALPQEVKEFLAAYQGTDQLTTAWNLALTPGYAVKVTSSVVGTMLITARLGKEGHPELWGWWEGADGTLQHSVWSGVMASKFEKEYGLDTHGTLDDLKGDYLKSAEAEEKTAQHIAPAGAPPEAILPATAVVPESAPKFTEGPLAKGTVIKVKKKVPGYEKKQEVTLTVLQNGQLLVEIPGQTAQTFLTLSAASDHVWVVQKGFTDAADYKAKNKTNKVPSGGGWKFWGISPKAVPDTPASELGAGAGPVPAPVTIAPPVPGPGVAVPIGTDPVVPKGGATLEFLEAAAYGTKIQTDDGKGNKTVYEKLYGGKWKVTLINKFASADTAEITTAEAYNMMQDEKIESWEGLGAPVPEKAGGKFPTDLEAFSQLPVWTTAQTKSSWGATTTYVKEAADKWMAMPESGESQSYDDIQALGAINGEKLDAWKLGVDKKPAAIPSGPLPPPSLEQIKAYPLGTKVHVNVHSHPSYVYVKTAAGWSNLESGNTYKDLTVANSWKQPFNEITKIEVPEKESIFDALPGFAETAVKFGTDEDQLIKKVKQATQSLNSFSKIPVGTVITTKGSGSGQDYVYTKTNMEKELGEATWKVQMPGAPMTALGELTAKLDIASEVPLSWKDPEASQLDSEPGVENWAWFALHPVEAANKVKPSIKAGDKNFDVLPAGTRVQFSVDKKMDAPVHIAIKVAQGTWEVIWEDGKHEEHSTDYLKSLFTTPEVVVKKLVGPGISFTGELQKPGKGDLQTLINTKLELLIKTGDFAFLPKGTVIQSESKSGAIQYKYVKESDNFWKTYSDGTNVGSLSSDVVATELKDEVITSWKKPGGAAFTPETESTPAEEVPPEVPSVGNQVELVNQIKASAKLAGISGFEDIIKALIALPPGIVLKTEGTMGQEYQYQKQADGSWATISEGLNLVTGIPPGSLAVDLKHEIITAFTPAGQPVVPEKDKAAKGAPPLLMKPVADFPKDNLEAFKKLPIGTTVLATTAFGNTWTYTKTGENSWSSKSPVTGKTHPEVPDHVLFADVATEKVVTFGVPTQNLPATWEEFGKIAEGKVSGKQTVTNSEYAPYLEYTAKFSALPVGTVINTQHKTGNTYEYTKLAPDAWEIVSSGGQKYAFHDTNALSDIKGETILSWAQPVGTVFPENVHTDYSTLPTIVQDVLSGIKDSAEKGKTPKDGATHAPVEKPSGWADWVPPPGVIVSGEWQGKKYYVINGQFGYPVGSDTPNKLVQFGIVDEDGKIHLGSTGEDPDDALAYALTAAGIGTSAAQFKEVCGLGKITFPVGSSIYNLSGTQNPLASKPVAQMTPAEKATKVKTSMALQDALKTHPLLQEGMLKFKKAKGTAMYVCLDGVEGASTKLYNAFKELGVEHHIKNKGGLPKVNAQGAFVTIDGQVLKYTQVEVETTALESSSVKHEPSDPNWQTMPEAKPKPKKKKTKAQLAAEKEAAKNLEAAKQKAVAIKAWAVAHPPMTDKGQLQLLAYLQKDFASYQIPVGVIARVEDGALVLSHKTHQKQLAYYLKLLQAGEPFQVEAIETPWGEAVKVDIDGIQKALEKRFKVGIGKMITGPDGKQYPDGTTFQKKTSEHKVSDLISSEPGFYKIKEHATDPENLAFLKVSGTSPESMAQMKAIIVKYGLESPHAEPKLGSGSVVHSIFKKSLEKVYSSEETYQPTIPEQPDNFVQSGLPYVDTGEYWAEVGDGSADLVDVASIKPSRYGHAIRVGAPGELRDFCIRFRRVIDPVGQLYYEFTGDLVQFDGMSSKLGSGKSKFGSTLGATIPGPDGDILTTIGFDTDTGTHTEYDSSISGAPKYDGFFGKTDAGSSIMVIPPSSMQDTFKNTFRVRIPASENPLSELREALQKMGKDPDKVLAPITEDSDRIYKKSVLVRGLMGASGWNEGKFPVDTMHNENWLDGKLSELGGKGMVKGLKVVKTFDNHISVIADDAEQFKTWSFPYVGASLDGTFLQFMQGSGWASRKDCLVHGVWHTGQSPGPDMKCGGSKGTFFRVAGEGSVMSEAYDCQIIFHPRIFKRVDWWRYNGDGYGNTTSEMVNGHTVYDSPKRKSTKLGPTNEILFEGGIGLKDAIAVVIGNNDKRQQMIHAMKKAGKTEINGKPLEEFFISAVHKGAKAHSMASTFAAALGITPLE